MEGISRVEAAVTVGPTTERGSVLVVVVLLSLGMYVLAHGLLVSAQATLTTARYGARLAERIAVADGALAHLVRQGPPSGSALAPVGEARSLLDSAGSVPVEGTWRRVDRETWLVRGRTSTPAGTMVQSGSRLVWWPDPVVRVRALPATVSVGPAAGTAAGGTIRNATIADERAEASAALTDACEPIWTQWSAGEVAAAPTPAEVGTIAAPALGVFDAARLMRGATAVPSDTGTPGPRTFGGACATGDPWNWGDPEHPAAVCADHWALVASRTSLYVDGGVGQGMLLVDGDLVLRSDARFEGLVVVTGAVRLVDRAVLTGFVIAGSGLDTSGDAVVVRSVCRAARALAGVRPALGAAALHGALDFIPR